MAFFVMTTMGLNAVCYLSPINRQLGGSIEMAALKLDIAFQKHAYLKLVPDLPPLNPEPPISPRPL